MKRYTEIKTPALALESKVINLREIAGIYNEELPVLLIKAWLVNFSLFMDFAISPQQARETAIYVFEETFMLNIAELTLLFKRIKTGHYGEFYGKFNPQIVLRACREYRQERGKIISKMPSDQQKEVLKYLYTSLEE